MKPEEKIMVKHNVDAHRFEATVDGHLAVADYAIEGERMIFTHTFVPAQLRGRGLAEKLVRVGLEHARSERLRVVPACSYVAAFIERHAEFKPLLG
ncbi:MAG: GNAT family N-acetyltransferase [Opitutaceae bacterium]